MKTTRYIWNKTILVPKQRDEKVYPRGTHTLGVRSLDIKDGILIHGP